MKRLYYLIIIALTILIAIPNVVKASCTDGNPNDNCNGQGTCYNVAPGSPLINVSINSTGVCLSIVSTNTNIGSFVLVDSNCNGNYGVWNPVTNYSVGGYTGAPNCVYLTQLTNPAVYGTLGSTGSILIYSANSSTYSAAVGLSWYYPAPPNSWGYLGNSSSSNAERWIDLNYGSNSSIDKAWFQLANCSSASYTGAGWSLNSSLVYSGAAGFRVYEIPSLRKAYSTTLTNDCTWHLWFIDGNINYSPIFYIAAGQTNFWMAFTGTTSGSPGLIPVVLSSFSATSKNNQITIQWQTSQENSNAGFNIYKSTDNVNYSILNNIIIAPNQNNYTYTDNNVVNGTKYYYKLEDVSLSGAKTMHNNIAWAIPSPANLDGSGIVTGNDLIILSQAMGSKPGMSNWNPKADLNGDRVVDAKDLQILQQYFGDQLSGVAVATTVTGSNVNSGLQPAQYGDSLLPIANTAISAPLILAAPTTIK